MADVAVRMTCSVYSLQFLTLLVLEKREGGMWGTAEDSRRNQRFTQNSNFRRTFHGDS
jgi:hypothetical protein